MERRFWPSLARLCAQTRTFGLALLMILLPLAVWAQGQDEDEQIRLDPQGKAIQLWTYVIVAVVVVLIVIWYVLRRRQLLRSDETMDSPYRDD